MIYLKINNKYYFSGNSTNFQKTTSADRSSYDQRKTGSNAIFPPNIANLQFVASMVAYSALHSRPRAAVHRYALRKRKGQTLSCLSGTTIGRKKFHRRFGPKIACLTSGGGGF